MSVLAHPFDLDEDSSVAPPNSVLGKAFSILSAFDGDSDSLRLVDLCERSGVPKPSVYRLAQELVALGLLERVGHEYRIGFSVFALSQRAGSTSLLRRVGRPVLVDLVASTRGTAHLAVREGTHTCYLEKLGGTRSVHSLSRVGGRLPLTCTASGKLLLAMAPDSNRLLDQLVESDFPRLTAQSARSMHAVRREMVSIRNQRLATEREEALVGYKSFAVPIYDSGDNAIAALSLTVPVDHTGDAALINALRLASHAITRQHTHAAMSTPSVFPAQRLA
ncbi:IclR family transcriptional regulator [Rhodococcus fascians]|uniref:IclR family transcriptional regulator n=1 Tax=Rhodococcoides fascians TaxID=1828 RepID=UPI001427A1E6|nr:IclR family transcriptional regulator [Rhodococcus fascians]MBY3996915.1 IclR family transcriptional regulator [Rhodococcus fascians]MBY4000921.1 IclR family transcriptional regulator [Rhodococcus fascians]MBY4007339.1 IclR family transcriptional regulator [Rhodococcus fascians]MBY4015656.1 IclR family transcriptional regulator [Rhodococcus fascians]